MKLLGSLLLALLWQAPTPDAGPRAEQRFFRYRALVQLSSGTKGRACAVLPAAVFAHAGATLADLRLYAGAAEVPFVVTESKSTLEPPDPARVLNLGLKPGGRPGGPGTHLVFDLAMPARAYTDVALDLAGQNFLATAEVAGEPTPGAPHPTLLGDYTLFDLTGQHLSRNTVLPLPESSFPFLHVDLLVSAAPGFVFTPTPAMVAGAEVPPDLEAQTLYTPVVSTSAFAQRGRETFAALDLPARVPVERIRFRLRPGPVPNFSRPVEITATPVGTERDGSPSAPERISGEISRVRLPGSALAGPVESESLSIAATLGANLQRPASVEVAVRNGDDPPLPLASVVLEMRERNLCFEVPARPAGPLALFYGDSAAPAPDFDYARMFNPAVPAALARLGPEQSNPGYSPRPEPARAWTERHPGLLWLALLVVVAALGGVALREGRRLPQG